MMMEFLKFTVDQAIIIAVVLPIIAVCFFILAIPWLRNGSGSKLRRYLSYTITPPKIGSDKSESPGSATDENCIGLGREDKVRLSFYYLGIVLFIVSFMIGEFYEVMFDLSLPVNQGSTGEFRTATTVVFQSIFNAGWIGELPWAGFTAYYETWNWIFFTAPLSDNPNFFENIIIVLFLISVVVGLIFLSPLALKSVRQSFIPSLFFFMTGMTIFTKAAVGYFAEIMALAFANAQLQYIHIVVTGDMFPNLVELVVGGSFIVLGMLALFLVLGRKLWRVHYSDTKSRTGFMAYITLCFLLGLALTIIMV